MFREESKVAPNMENLTPETQDMSKAAMMPGAGMTPPVYQPVTGPHTGFFPGIPSQGLELARVYIPFQRFGPLFDLTRALDFGTLFPELYRPYPF